MKLDLDRYNRVLWALLGTLALVGLLALLIGGLVSLWPAGKQSGGLSKVLQSPEERTAPPASTLSLGLPTQVKGTDTLLVAVEDLNHEEEEEPRGFGSYSKGGPERSVVNLLFVNSRTRESQALLNTKSLITRHEVLDDESGDEDRGSSRNPRAKAAGLALRIVESDTNGNGRLDDEDDERIYLCDASGKNLRAVTAPGQTCLNWQYDSERRVLYLLMRDKVQDTGKAPTDVYSVSLDGSQPAQPLVSKVQMDGLRTLLQR